MKQFKLTFLLIVIMSMVGTKALAHDFELDGIYYLYNEDGDGTVSVTFKGNSSWQGYNEYSGNVVIPSSFYYNGRWRYVTRISQYAFHMCQELTSVTIPSGVWYIEWDAFYCCSGLTSINIPFGVKWIGQNAFEGCSNLTSITIPNSVTSVIYPFKGCYNLTSIEVESGNQYLDSRNSCNAIIETSSNKLIAGCKTTIIPNSVTSIGESAFSGCSSLTSIEIPNSVTSIREYAFSGCSGLTSIEIPNSVTSIGSSAFGNTAWYNNHPDGLVYAGKFAYKYKGTMPANTSITIKDGTLGIAGGAFSGCTGLTSITIPNSVTSIGSSAFSGCSGLTSIEIPNSVTSIGNSAFSGCSGLTSIEIPNSVTSIGYSAFWDCTGLTSIEIPNSVTSIREYAFSGCSGLTSIEIPNSVTSIGNYAFSGCSGLTSIEIPNSVTSIGNYAFDGCSGLTSVTIKKETPLPIKESTFSNRANATLYVPYGSKAAYEAANYWKEFKEIIEVVLSPIIAFADANVKNICVANWDTNGDGELSEEEAADVTDLGQVFKGNEKLTSFEELEYFTGLTSISNSSFAYCRGLTSLTIPNSVTSIGDEAFSGCWDLTSITIPNNVTTIGDDAFRTCKNLASITIGNSVTSIGDRAFSWCNDGIASIVVSSDNKTFDSRDGCNAIISSQTNTLIVGCKNTIIPNSVTSIGYCAFLGCYGLTSITIPNSVTKIGDWAFTGCYDLQSVSISNSVTSIGDDAFYGYNKLTSITIPNSVTSIGSDAFGLCELTSVTVNNTEPLFIDISTFNNRENTTLYVPYGCKAAYETAAVWKEFKEIVEMDPVTTITAKSYTIEYGDDLPTFEFTSEGTTIEGTPTITCEATKTSPVGTYPIVIAKGSVTNSIDTYVNGTLTITKAPLTITAKDYTVKQCDNLPTFEVEYEGFKNDETYEVLSNQPVISWTATSTNTPGEYKIIVSGADAQNYDITYVAGKLTIEKLSFEQTIPAGQQWQTFISEMPCKLSEDSHAKVYAVSSIDNENVYVEEYPDGIPANCMVLVGLDSNPEEPTAITFDYYEQASSIQTLLMGGVSETTGLVPYRTYVLYNDEFVLNSGSSVAAGIGYLTKQSAGARENLNIVIDGGATSVRKPVSVPDNTDTWYDLNGRKLSGYPTKKGIYLNNNKKIVIK